MVTASHALAPAVTCRQRFVAHLDMDAFYASVELLRQPQLRGQAVVVGGRRVSSAQAPGRLMRDYAGRGVVTTSTYEARALGVRSGMPLMKAARRAPDAVLLPADFDEYRRYSRIFKSAVRAITPEIEDRGIDEIYVDLTRLTMAGGEGGALDPWERARELASGMQQAVFEASGLTCSIAVAPNKLLAKIGSDLDKPAGLTVIRPGDLHTRIWPLPVRCINGIGPKAAAALSSLGIHNIGELAAADTAVLALRFGEGYGAWMKNAACGRDDRAIVTDGEPKSISRESTFETDLHPRQDRERLSRIFTGLCVKVAGDLERKGYLGRKIGLKLRYDNFETVTRDLTLEMPTCDARAIRMAAGDCLKRVPLDRRIRLLGVRVGALTR